MNIKKEVARIEKLQRVAVITKELQQVQQDINAQKKIINNKHSTFMACYAAMQWLEDLCKKKKHLLEELIKDV